MPLQTGDLLCTCNGSTDILVGQFWRLIGRLLPGEVDHVVVYVGPGGRCVEAGPLGVNAFTFQGSTWQPLEMLPQRGPFIDTLIGVAYPLLGRDLARATEWNIRLAVGAYCLEQARLHKPYNIHFLDSEREDAFYCSQLAYRAYRPYGINLNSGWGLNELPGSESIIFPEEIWAGCLHRRV